MEGKRQQLAFIPDGISAIHKIFFESSNDNQLVDSVNSETGEIIQVDQLQDILINHCAKNDDFISENSPLTIGISNISFEWKYTVRFEEISKIAKPPAKTILKTLDGPRVYKGIRPIL